MRPDAPWFWDQWKKGLRPNEATSTIRRLDWSTKLASGSDTDRNRVKSFDADGDHLTIARVSGGLPVYVRFSDSDAAIRVFSRMVLTRPFRKVLFMHGQQAFSLGSGGDGEARVVAYVTHGPLVAQWPPKEYGFRRSPLMLRNLTATTTPQDLHTFFLGVPPTNTDTAGLSHGLEGGTVVIKNTDPASDLYIGNGNTSTPLLGATGFGPIAPGQSITLQLEDMLMRYANVIDTSQLTVFTLAGTCTFSMMFSSGEGVDSENLIDAEHNPSLK